jgi:uncharacterized protein (TIGR01244 family)
MPECVNTAELIAAQKAALIRFDIDERLTLAGQPQPDDWTALAAEGFQVVINMRSDPERAAVQQRNAEAAGLQYIHLPLRSTNWKRTIWSSIIGYAIGAGARVSALPFGNARRPYVDA